jgi:putative ABC transport system permease protein
MRFILRLINVVRPHRAEPDLARELEAHLALMEDDFRRRGLSADEARLAARRAFGSVALTKDQHRDARSFVWLDDARRDLRHSMRLLRRNPLFTLTATVSLAIGIGANTTIFTVAQGLLFHTPAGVAQPDRVVDIGTTRNGYGFGTASYPNVLDLRARATTFDGVYATGLFPAPVGLSAGDATERVFAYPVSLNYFTVLGAHPAAGRLFGDGDSEQPAASPIVVLSHGFWTRRFNRDRAIVGQSLRLNGRPFTVVGVASEGFQGTGIRTCDLWMPLTTPATTPRNLTDRAAASLLVGGRLRDGVPITRAAAEVNAIALALQREYPEENKDRGLTLTTSSPVPGGVTPIAVFLALLMVIVGIVLVIACANLAAVLLARAAARRREIAVRLAMGAGRARLVRQLLTETLLLFVLGGAAGMLLARTMTSLLASLLPALPFPVEVSLAPDGRALAFTAGLSLIAAVLSGLAPALQATKADVVPALKDDAESLFGRSRLRQAFVVAQVALSLVLVIVAGLFARALRQVVTIDPGFDPRGVELASIDPSQAGYTATTGPLFVRSVLDRVRQMPDVTSATIAAVLPGGFEVRRNGLSVPGARPPGGQRFWDVDWNIVEPGYFATLRIAMTAGRDFSDADRAGTPLVAVISEAAARRFWPGKPTQEALGQSLMQPAFGPRGPTNDVKALRVIGVARDIKANSLVDGATLPSVYVPLQQQYTPAVTIVARTTHGQRIANEMRSIVAAINPELPIISSQTLEESVALGLVPQRIAASVAGSLGLVGLLLAAVGIYGVTAYAVTRRTREIGIRVALGAQRGEIVGLVLSQGMSLVLIGAIIGLTLAAGAGMALAPMLFGVPAIDPVTFAGAALLFGIVSVIACYVPARRATRVDPLTALRCE